MKQKVGEDSDFLQSNQQIANETKLSAAALASAAIQGACAFAVAMNSVKVLLGITSVAVAGGASWLHSDPVRLILRYFSAVLATATVYLVWNGWRLRNRSSAQWRKAPLSRRKRWRIAVALGSALLSWLLIVAEIVAHHRLFPR